MREKTFNVFILEDDPTRIRKFKQRFMEEMPEDVYTDIEHTDSVEKAKKVLSSVCFDLVLLDHDLALEDEGSITPKNETGYDLASWLAENPDIAEEHVRYICHSLNHPGRNRIMAALGSIGIICREAPFLWEQGVFWKFVGSFMV